MIELQIPYWAMTACGGWVLGVASLALLGGLLGRRKQKKMLNELSKIAVEFEAPQEGEGDVSTDDVDQR